MKILQKCVNFENQTIFTFLWENTGSVILEWVTPFWLKELRFGKCLLPLFCFRYKKGWSFLEQYIKWYAVGQQLSLVHLIPRVCRTIKDSCCGLCIILIVKGLRFHYEYDPSTGVNNGKGYFRTGILHRAFYLPHKHTASTFIFCTLYYSNTCLERPPQGQP